MRFCTVDGCPKRHYGRGYCIKHYTRFKRHGATEIERANGTNEERFWRKVDRRGPDECWNWQGSLGYEGYGTLRVRVGVGSRMVKAHRFAYELHKGPIPAGLTIDHLCRNRACVNPAHLEAVTQAENTLRGESPAANAARRDTCANGHPYTDETEASLREMLDPTPSYSAELRNGQLGNAAALVAVDVLAALSEAWDTSVEHRLDLITARLLAWQRVSS